MKYFHVLFDFLSPKKELEKDDFSEFFTDRNSREKAKLIKTVLKEANREQRELVQKYRELEKTA